ncbi:MAG: GGDEF domain-containing protein [Chloroflexi bacterium]|nr:GGDEF domain-containing protein [Chloroflexota bacterium]
MKSDHPNGKGQKAVSNAKVAPRRVASAAHRALDADQTSADADQSSADADQTLADTDQIASASDQTSADRDQHASDHDQAAADRERAAHHNLDTAEQSAFDASRNERQTGSFERLGNRLDRAGTARHRDATANDRDRIAGVRDQTGRARDARTAVLTRVGAMPEASLAKRLEELRARAAADRARAAADRERAAADRAAFAQERARLEAELRSAHLDELTGAYRREMGRLALSHEIDRARRSDGRFVLAFVDVDRLKVVNDRDGHAAGDRVLQTVVDAIRTRLRSFDPIVRYGGDEFVCGLGGTDLAEAKRRFTAIGVAIEANARVGISVGFAALGEGDTPEQLTERADAAMLKVKAVHHAVT